MVAYIWCLPRIRHVLEILVSRRHHLTPLISLAGAECIHAYLLHLGRKTLPRAARVAHEATRTGRRRHTYRPSPSPPTTSPPPECVAGSPCGYRDGGGGSPSRSSPLPRVFSQPIWQPWPGGLQWLQPVLRAAAGQIRSCPAGSSIFQPSHFIF
jgi:hypothetical protein